MQKALKKSEEGLNNKIIKRFLINQEWKFVQREVGPSRNYSFEKKSFLFEFQILPMYQNATWLRYVDEWHSVQGFAIRNSVWADAPSVSSGSASLTALSSAKDKKEKRVLGDFYKKQKEKYLLI